MTTGANCETTYENGQTTSARVPLRPRRRSPPPLGFRLTVDAVRFELAPLDLGKAEVAAHLSSPGMADISPSRPPSRRTTAWTAWPTPSSEAG